jgi:hypothetical protein
MAVPLSSYKRARLLNHLSLDVNVYVCGLISSNSLDFTPVLSAVVFSPELTIPRRKLETHIPKKAAKDEKPSTAR